MAFTLLVVYLVFTFVRPAEQISSLAAWRLMEVVSILALTAAAFGVLTRRGPTFRAVQIPLFVAFVVWAVLSVLVNPTAADEALEDVLGFAKSSGVAFLLLILNVDTARRLRLVAVVLSIAGLFVVGQGALAYHVGVGASLFVIEGSESQGSSGSWEGRRPQPLDEGLDLEGAGEPPRIRGLGFVGDPNDLACTLVAILPLLFALRLRKAPFRNALLVWIPAGVLVYGIYLTRSRGGIVALACVLALSVNERLGRALSILAGGGALMAFLALGFLGGRSMTIDESAASRIEAWSEGLIMLRSSPVWGVGFGMFTQHHVRVAHSSFVHCFAELGLVGYFLWLSLVVLTLDDMRCVARVELEGAGELRRWARALMLSLVGFLAGGVFLSRSYDVILFILLGVGVAIDDLARRSAGLPARGLLVRSFVVVAVEVTSILILWLYMRLLR